MDILLDMIESNAVSDNDLIWIYGNDEHIVITTAFRTVTCDPQAEEGQFLGYRGYKMNDSILKFTGHLTVGEFKKIGEKYGVI